MRSEVPSAASGKTEVGNKPNADPSQLAGKGMSGYAGLARHMSWTPVMMLGTRSLGLESTLSGLIEIDSIKVFESW